jgi:hypothetical protein
MSFCPVCESGRELLGMDLSEDLLSEMAQRQGFADGDVSLTEYNNRLEICYVCPSAQGMMTCAECGCFIQFKAKSKGSFCPIGKW